MNNRKKKYNYWSLYALATLLLVSHFFLDKKVEPTPEIATPNVSVDTTLSSEPKPVNDEVKVTEVAQSVSLPIFMYHYIRVVADQSDAIGIGLSVTPERFASQLDTIIQKGYKTITFNDVASGNIPDKSIILTFDDGYQDFYTNAFPELKKRGMTAVVFIITDETSPNYMTSNEIKELADNGIEVGSHTLTHPDLSSASDQRANNEITQSKSKLEAITGKAIISFCYPSGKHSDSNIKTIETAGYKYATTTKSGRADFNDPFLLNRYRITEDVNIGAYLK